MKILVLGAAGMLGNAVIRILNERSDWEVYGSVRSGAAHQFFPNQIVQRLIVGGDVVDHDAFVNLFTRVRPNVVINCIGLVKQLEIANNPLQAIPINSLLPHRLAELCALMGGRLVHVSTDCVFSGDKGGYTENDYSDARDVYGRTKYLGEVDSRSTVTLRTSIIGHSLRNTHGLLDWFISQQDHCKGFRNALFSGVPAVELARIIRDFVIPLPKLSGVYHIAAKPISKFLLLELIANVYKKTIQIEPDDHLVINRSLNADRFTQSTGYIPPKWPDLIDKMYEYKLNWMIKDVRQ